MSCPRTSCISRCSASGLESAIRTTNGNIARIMDRASRALRDVQPLMLTLRGVNSFGNAAFVEVHDERNGLAPLRDALVHVLHQIGLPGFGPAALSAESPSPEGEAPHDQPDPINAPPFLPHMSLCYYREHYPTPQIKAIIEPYREMEMGTLRHELRDARRRAALGFRPLPAHYPHRRPADRLNVGE